LGYLGYLGYDDEEKQQGETVPSEGGGRDVKYDGNLAFAVVVAGKLGDLEGAGPWIINAKNGSGNSNRLST
jgi:hypothetical protein